jgi:lipopolysaccharide biosynthesis glycosyltransferase
MRNLIVTLNSYEEFKYNEQSIESMRHAARRWGADFYEKTYFEDENLPGKRFIWGKFWLLNNFENYDNVLYLDLDTIINSNSPNIFNETNDRDILYVVLDGNPGRFKNNFFKKNYSYNFSIRNNSINIFNKIIDFFDEKKYFDHYFNAGIILYKPKKFKPHFEEFLKFIKNDEIQEYLKNGGGDQNLLNGWFSTKNIDIKYLDNTWNWIAPDIVDEYDMFLGPMKPNIYHFCGTDLSKERLKTYDRWKTI